MIEKLKAEVEARDGASFAGGASTTRCIYGGTMPVSYARRLFFEANGR